MRPRTKHRDSPPPPSLRTSLLLSAMLFGTLGAFGLLAHALPNAPDPKGRTPRQIAIQNSIAKLHDHAWAGRYYMGDGLGENIRVDVAPDGGVSAQWRGCMGVYGKNEGDILQQHDGSLHFAFATPNKQGFGGFDEDVQPVQWGKRHYLIASKDMIDFINAVNMGNEPREGPFGRFLLRNGDEELPADGLPALPEQYAKLIRQESVEFAIQRIEPLPARVNDVYCDLPYRLAFDTHGDPALRVGSELKSTEFNETVKVISIDGTQAIAEVTIYGGKTCAEIKHAPTLQGRLRTGAVGVKWEGLEGCDKPEAEEVVEATSSR